jgi:hypothetical protein
LGLYAVAIESENSHRYTATFKSGENQNLPTTLQGLGNSQYDAPSESLNRKGV